MMTFPAPGLHEPLCVTYVGPVSQWLFKGAVVVFVTLILGIMFSGVMWGLVGPAIWTSTALPVWWHWSVAAALIVLVVGLVKVASREMRRKIALMENHFWIGGFMFGKTYPYERVRIIKLVHPENTLGKSHQLVIEFGPRRNTSLWLRPGDAEECFDAMRSLCPQAPAIGLDDHAFEPAEEKFAGAGHSVLAEEFRKKSSEMLRCSIVSAVIGVGLVVALIFGGPGVRHHPKAWIGAIVLPAVAAGTFGASRRYKQVAREHMRRARQAHNSGD